MAPHCRTVAALVLGCALLAGGGADLAGIRPNDVIIAINSTSVPELDVFRKGEVKTVVVMRQAYTK